MADILIKDGAVLRVGDMSIKFLRKVKGSYIFETLDTCEIKSYSAEALIDLIYSGKADLINADPSGVEKASDLHKSFDLLPEAQRTIAMERLLFVNSYAGKIGAMSTERAAREALKEVFLSHDEVKIPSVRTLQRWHRMWCEGGKTVCALVPRLRDRGTREHRISETVLDMVRQVIDDHFLKRDGRNVSGTYQELKVRISEINKKRPDATKLDIPSQRTFYRLVGEIDPYTVTVARQGQKAADMLYLNSGVGVVAKYPLHIVQMDHTKLDVLIVSEDGDLLGRCWLTLALDLYSRMVVGVHLSFDEPKYASVMHCIRNAITPKHLLGEPFKSVAEAWLCFGVMSTILLDNGLDFHSGNLLEACAQLNIDISYCPKYTPHYKGAVERVFGTLNTKLIHTLPGTTFSDPKKRGDYKSEQNACLTFPELYRLIVEFFAYEYSNTVHKGINKTPLYAWKIGTEKHPVRTISSRADLDILTAYSETRHLRKTGIEIFGLFYNSTVLDVLRLRHFKSGCDSFEVQVKYDPEDISKIYVADEENAQFLAVECTMPDYAEGLNLWQHNYIKNKVRKGLKPGETADLELLIRCRRNCFGIVEAAKGRQKKPSRKEKKMFGNHENGANSQLVPSHSNDDLNITLLSNPLNEDQLKDLADGSGWDTFEEQVFDGEEEQ